MLGMLVLITVPISSLFNYQNYIDRNAMPLG